MNESPELPVEALRRLARGLLYDRALAEDAVQDAWLAALQKRSEIRELGRWLAGSVRRLARNRARDEALRAQRERRAARPEALDSAAELSSRFELLHRLLDAADRLDEPYRTAIGLRYFEDLPPRAIAQRLGIPVNTARTHVRRGLERLRRDLDGERGQGRQEFLAALAPFAGKAPWSVTLGIPRQVSVATRESGALLMKSPIVLGVVLVAGAAWFWLRSSSGEPNGREGTLAAATNEARSMRADASAAEELIAPDSRVQTREPLGPDSTALSATWTVRGHVFKGKRAPFAGAELVGRVFAGPKHEGAPILEQRIRADESADFSWSIAPPAELETVQVEPVRSGQQVSGWSDVFLPGDPAPQPVVVYAYPYDGVLRGIVRDQEGNVVAGARVIPDLFAPDEAARTDSRGWYELSVSSLRGSLSLNVLAAGHARASVHLDRIVPGDQTLDVALEPELRVRGRVLDEAGTPIAGARVDGFYPYDIVATTTDDDGGFDLGGLDNPGKQVTLWASRLGFVGRYAQFTVDGLAQGVEIRLSRGVHVSGRVLAPDRTPVAGAWVSVNYVSYPRNSTYADAAGLFELPAVPTGTQHLWLWRQGFAELRYDLRVPEDSTTLSDVEIVLSAPHFLAGRVVDEEDRPVPWAFIEVEDPKDGSGDKLVEGFWTHADADGLFRFDGLPDVPMKFSVQREGCATLEQPVTALDRDDVVLHLQRSAHLTGRAIDGASGAPVTSFTVRVVHQEGRSVYPSSWDRGLPYMSTDGVWRLDDDLAPGSRFMIEIKAAGFAPGGAWTTSAVDANPDACVVRFQRGARISGHVLDKATGHPIEGAQVRTRSMMGARAGMRVSEAEARTDAAGRFELAGVLPGSMTLSIEAGEIGAVDGPFDVVGERPVERWIELATDARLSGRLLDADGRALAGEQISAWGAEVLGDRREWFATTDARGAYSLENLPAGIFQLRWMRVRDGVKSADLELLVTLQGGEQRTIDLQPRGASTLRGTLACPGCDLPHVVELTLSRPSTNPRLWADGQRGGFAIDGRFEVQHLEPGTYWISAYAALADGTQRNGQARVEVPQQGEVEVQLSLERR